MAPSLQQISNSYIPANAFAVEYCFKEATTPDDVPYGYKTRCLWAAFAITCSAVNTVGYSLTILNRVFVVKLFYGHDNLAQACREDAAHVFQSLRFVAAMTTYLFMTIIGYSLVLPRPVIPFELRAEYRAPILHSTVDVGFPLLPPCEVPGLQFKLFADTNTLKIDTVVDRNVLLGILASRSDLVLILSPDQSNAYLIQRTDAQVRTGVMAGTLNFFVLTHDDVAIAPPLPATRAVADTDLSADDLQRSLHDLSSSQVSAIDEFVLLRSTAPGSVDNRPPPSAVAYLGNALQSAWGQVVGHDHLIKEIKYRHILLHFFTVVTKLHGLDLYNKACRVKADGISPLKTKCLELYQIITEPYKDVRRQHQDFILALREARDLLKDSDPVEFKNWIEFLALDRYARIQLFGYCRSLVEKQTGPFNVQLTLDTFVDELDRRNARVQTIPVEEGLTFTVRTAQRLAGHFNWKDFLLKYNIPYIYGQIRREGKKTVTVLRHGSPVADYSLIGRLKVTSDYIAFVQAAASRNENILHIILENGVPKEGWVQKLKGGEESHRVQARLAIGDANKNFYPMALRLDGPFVQPKTYHRKSYGQVKDEFSRQMFGVNTGYLIHDNLRTKGLTPRQFEGYMYKVKSTFFSDRNSFDSLQDFQAFIVLTYAEMILDLCDTLEISYLEAGCKDDIDRGGAMKAIITLLHLYRTRKFAPEAQGELHQALENLMVNIIAAPLIVRKDEIIESRADYVKHVVHVLQRTIIQAPVPVESYMGNFNILTEQYQGIIPTGSICRTENEYQEFLSRARSDKMVFRAGLEQNLVLDCSEQYRKDKNTHPIKHQVELEFSRMNMWVNNGKLERRDLASFDISAHLIQELARFNIVGEAAWAVLSVFNQSIGRELVASLVPLFNHETLGYIISPDNERMMRDGEAGLYLTLVQDQASIKFVLLFKIISPIADGKVIGRVRTTLEIPDHRIAGATVTTTVDPVSTC